MDVLDREVTSRRGRERRERCDLDVLGADPMRRAAQRLDALDAKHVRADPVDARAERDEEPAEVLDMRLAGRVPDDRVALREDGGHDRVLRRHHRRLVEVEPLPDQLVGAELVGAVQVDRDPELGERVDVGVEAAASDDVAAGWRDDRATEPREERTGEEERGSDLAAELRIERCLRHVARVDDDLVRRGPRRVGAHVDEQLDHRLDVADPRDVRQRHRFGGEDGGGEDR